MDSDMRCFMKIKKIISIDIDSKEVDVLMTDGIFELMAYGHPIENIENQDISMLFGFMCENIILTEEDIGISKLEDYYSYELIAKVISKEDCVVAIGGILIKLDTPIPNDVDINMKVMFSVKRVDII